MAVAVAAPAEAIACLPGVRSRSSVVAVPDDHFAGRRRPRSKLQRVQSSNGQLEQSPSRHVHVGASKRAEAFLAKGRPQYTHSHTEGKPFFDSPAAAMEAPVSMSLVPVTSWTPPPLPVRGPKPKTMLDRAEDLRQASEATASALAERRSFIDDYHAFFAGMMSPEEDPESNGGSDPRTQTELWTTSPEYACAAKFRSKGGLDQKANHLKRAAVSNANYIAERKVVIQSLKKPADMLGLNKRPHSAPQGKPQVGKAQTALTVESRPGTASSHTPVRSASSPSITRPGSAAAQRSRTLSTGSAQSRQSSVSSPKRSTSASSLILSWPHLDVKTQSFAVPALAWLGSETNM